MIIRVDFCSGFPGADPGFRKPTFLFPKEEFMKKAFLKLAAAAIATAMVAGSMPVFAGGTQDAKAPKETGPIELTIWTHEDTNRKALEEKYIAEFMTANPNITVKYVTYPSDKIQDIVQTGFAAKNGPDIFNMEIQKAYPFLAEGFVAPVDLAAAGYKSYKEIENSYMAGMLGPVTVDGKIYGLPLELTNWCIYLNKKIFRDAGLDPDKDYPKTWEDVMTLSEKIVKRDGQIITRRGFDFRYGDYLISWLPMVEQLGGKLVSDDGRKAIINDAAWIKALQYMADFGPNGKNLGSPTYTAARKVFDNDKNEIAMHLSGLYQEQRMAKANPTFYNSKDWMVIPYPTFKGGKPVPNTYYGHYYMVNSQVSAARQQAAWKLVAYMLGHGEEYLSKVALVQPTKALFDSATFKNMPYSNVFKADLEKAPIVYYGASSLLINNLVKEAVESVMLQKTAPEKAVETLRTKVQQALDEQ
jgi:multiple sugar transport system substrate-binding protein